MRGDLPTTGDVLDDRYGVGERVGRGGMADVYAADDIATGGRVAVKVFRVDVADAVDPNRTTRELRILGDLHAPEIVEVLGASAPGSEHPYLVMELVLGPNLGTVIAAGPLEAEHVRRIGVDIATALAALHAHFLLHRDVKPANVLVPDAGPIAAKLADFGIALAIDDLRLTGADSILGTAAYLSPEQVRGCVVGPASDVYALGLVLLEAMTGTRAFAGTLAETAVVRLTRAPALPRTASPALARLLSRMTALEPVARPSAVEVAQELGALRGAMTADPARLAGDSDSQITERMSAPRPDAGATGRRRRPRAAGVLLSTAAIVTVALGGAAVIAATFQQPAAAQAVHRPVAPSTPAPTPLRTTPPPSSIGMTTVTSQAPKNPTAPKAVKKAAAPALVHETAAQRVRKIEHSISQQYRHAANAVGSARSWLRALIP